VSVGIAVVVDVGAGVAVAAGIGLATLGEIGAGACVTGAPAHPAKAARTITPIALGMGWTIMVFLSLSPRAHERAASGHGTVQRGHQF
jgi:hypothetical protein